MSCSSDHKSQSPASPLSGPQAMLPSWQKYTLPHANRKTMEAEVALWRLPALKALGFSCPLPLSNPFLVASIENTTQPKTLIYSRRKISSQTTHVTAVYQQCFPAPPSGNSKNWARGPCFFRHHFWTPFSISNLLWTGPVSSSGCCLCHHCCLCQVPKII